MPKQDYKWTLVYDAAEKMYILSGYIKIGGEWTKDGASVRWSYIEAPLEHIMKQESENAQVREVR